MQRLFSFWQLLAFALIFMSSWEVMAMDMGATFYNGGPQTLAWGIVLVVVGAMAQALSMAELAAIQPIAGAQYHWTHFLAPQNHRRFITVRPPISPPLFPSAWLSDSSLGLEIHGISHDS